MLELLEHRFKEALEDIHQGGSPVASMTIADPNEPNYASYIFHAAANVLVLAPSTSPMPSQIRSSVGGSLESVAMQNYQLVLARRLLAAYSYQGLLNEPPSTSATRFLAGMDTTNVHGFLFTGTTRTSSSGPALLHLLEIDRLWSLIAPYSSSVGLFGSHPPVGGQTCPIGGTASSDFNGLDINAVLANECRMKRCLNLDIAAPGKKRARRSPDLAWFLP